MTQDQSPSDPSAIKELLQARVGTWDVDCSYFVSEGQPPIKAQATDEIRLLGERWTISDFRTEMMGAPFRGQATVGYEPGKDRWVATWVDSMTPHLFFFEGGYDASGRTFEATAEAPHPQTGNPTRYRTKDVTVSADERSFEMWMTLEDGEEFRISHYRYRRVE